MRMLLPACKSGVPAMPANDDQDMEDEIADELVAQAGPALEALLESPWGKRFELLVPEPEEAVMAMLGSPPDERPMWEDLGSALRHWMLADAGQAANRIAC